MIPVSIFEDNDQLRESLCLLIDAEPEFTLVAAYPDCTKAVASLEKERAEVVLMDIDMPGMSGLEGLRRIKKFFPDIHVVIHTVFEDEDKIFEAIQNGASGYILKSSTPEELIQALKMAHSGGASMTPSVAKKVLAHFVKLTPLPLEEYRLSGREKEILMLLVQGYSYKMCAAELQLSVETIRTYIKRVYEKLQVQNMSGAVAKAIKEGLV